MKVRVMSVAVGLVAVAGGVQPASAQSAKPFADLSRTILSGRDSLVRLTREQVGLRYQLGAKQPGKAFDCSALVQWIAGLFGKEMPRTAAQQALVGVEVAKDTSLLLPGDLLLFGKGKRVDHIGIYVGDGRYVHAANRRKGVIESEIARAKPTYWKAARRIFWDADSAIGFTPRVIGSPEG
ncbi:MAG: NlpC/P60 family protein [Gemmatimonadales bacterium]